MSRATSTVVDVTVFLLLLGAAAAVVVHSAVVGTGAATNRATERADLLATSTADIDYSLSPASDPPSWITDPSKRRKRTAHGTLAELLGEAALSRVSVDGHRLSRSGAGFEQAVGRTTRERLRSRGQRTAVRAHWAPYRGAPVNATMRVGERPPPAAPVDSATLTVASPAASVRTAARQAANESGYGGVAAVVAGAVVEGLFPPRQSQLALDGGYPERNIVATRYRRLGRASGAGQLDVGSRSATELNDRLATALAERLERDMRERFDSPQAAAAAVRTGDVTITVRTWSP